MAGDDLAALVADLPDLRMIAFNGGKAATIGRKQLPPLTDIALVDLPSSSAAHTIGFGAKLARWTQLRAALAAREGSLRAERWKGRIEGLAVGFALGYGAGRLR